MDVVGFLPPPGRRAFVTDPDELRRLGSTCSRAVLASPLTGDGDRRTAGRPDGLMPSARHSPRYPSRSRPGWSRVSARGLAEVPPDRAGVDAEHAGDQLEVARATRRPATARPRRPTPARSGRSGTGPAGCRSRSSRCDQPSASVVVIVLTTVRSSRDRSQARSAGEVRRPGHRGPAVAGLGHQDVAGLRLDRRRGVRARSRCRRASTRRLPARVAARPPGPRTRRTAPPRAHGRARMPSRTVIPANTIARWISARRADPRRARPRSRRAPRPAAGAPRPGRPGPRRAGPGPPRGWR